jgi:hypothetical protein
VTTTNLYTAGISSNVNTTLFNFDTLTIPFINSTTLNVASTSNLDTVTITGEPGLTSLNVTGNIYASNSITTTNLFASDIIFAGTALGTAVAGQTEYNTYLYSTINTTSGRGSVPVDYIYRLTSPTAAYGPASNNFFTGTNTGAGAGLNLEAASVYDIEAHCYFEKTTISNAIQWQIVASSAPTLMWLYYIGNTSSGISSAGAFYSGYVGGQAVTSVTTGTTGTLNGASKHSFMLKIQVVTNAATTIRLNVVQVSGTMTSLAGSYYRVTKISTTTGSYA